MTKLDIIQKSGSWFNMGETRLGQGRDNAKKFLIDNPDVAADIEAQVRANYDKLAGTAPARPAVVAAGKGVKVDADDFKG